MQDQGEIERWILSHLEDVNDDAEIVRRLDALVIDPDVGPAQRTAIECMAFQVAIGARWFDEGWRRYRLTVLDHAAAPGVLAQQVERLGDMASELGDLAALDLVRAELGRLLTCRSNPAALPLDRAAAITALARWERPDIIHAEKAFEAAVGRWLGADDFTPRRLRSDLARLARDACSGADRDVERAINGRRAFWAVVLLISEGDRVIAAWLEYMTHYADMSWTSRASSLLVLGFAVEHLEQDGVLKCAAARELEMLAERWPRPASLPDRRARDMMVPGLMSAAERLRKAARSN